MALYTCAACGLLLKSPAPYTCTDCHEPLCAGCVEQTYIDECDVYRQAQCAVCLNPICFLCAQTCELCYEDVSVFGEGRSVRDVCEFCASTIGVGFFCPHMTDSHRCEEGDESKNYNQHYDEPETSESVETSERSESEEEQENEKQKRISALEMLMDVYAETSF